MYLFYRKHRSCLYRVLGRKNETIKIENLHLNFTCEQGEMWIYTKYENFGPFCGEKRRKRGILTEIYNADFEGSLIRDLHFFFYQFKFLKIKFFNKPLVINLKRMKSIWYSKTTGCGFLLGLNSS